MGTSRLCELADLLAESPEALDILLRGVRSRGYPLILSRVPADSALYREYTSANGRHRALTKSLPSSTAAHIDTRGDASFDISCPEPADLEAAYQLAIRIEAASWKSRSGTSLPQRTDLQQFFGTYLQLACARKQVRMCFMYIGDHCV